MKAFKNILLITIVVLIILVLVLIGLKPVILSKKDNVKELSAPAIIELGVTPQTNSQNVLIANNNIYINSGGTYNISGILQNGTIFIDTLDEVTLNFNGVTLVNEQNCLIDNRKSTKIVLNLAEDSTNILSDGISSIGAIKSIGDVYLEGDGTLLIYGNKENGIDITGGNLIISNVSLYVMAQKSAFDVSGEILINSGTILGFGNTGIQIPSNMSKQNTMLFNFANTFKENTIFSLVDSSNISILDFASIRDFKTLTLSTPNLINGRYKLLKNTTCQKINSGFGRNCQIDNGEEVIINITNSYIVDDKWNWYGSMDNVINYNKEIIG